VVSHAKENQSGTYYPDQCYHLFGNDGGDGR